MRMTKIRKRRKKTGLGIDDALKVLGISKSSFYKIETGYRVPSMKVIIKMSKAYKCSVDSIIKDLNLDKELVQAQ